MLLSSVTSDVRLKLAEFRGRFKLRFGLFSDHLFPYVDIFYLINKKWLLFAKSLLICCWVVWSQCTKMFQNSFWFLEEGTKDTGFLQPFQGHNTPELSQSQLFNSGHTITEFDYPPKKLPIILKKNLLLPHYKTHNILEQ